MNKKLYQQSYMRVSKNISFLVKEAQDMHKKGVFTGNPQAYMEKLERYKEEINFYSSMKKELISKYVEKYGVN